MHNWYLAAGALLTFVVQAMRKVPWLRKWTIDHVPNGLRFLVPLVAGAVIAFSGAWLQGLALSAALMHALAGALAIGGGSMGLHAALKESPIPWDGASGGAKRRVST